ncbi:hypothetical protein B481_3334 [Planococcus halocryophilus Or1]|nr:hypothetical protein B481_3334 [Planococcus halocryophilus Or1]
MKKFLLISLSGFLIISGLLGYGIYWGYREETATIKWFDNHFVNSSFAL